jgi:hypothetical protein
LLLLALSDCHSYKRLKTDITANLSHLERMFKELLAAFIAEKEKPHRPILVNGNHLLQHFNLQPGRIIGDLLSVIKEAQGTGAISTRSEALALAEKKLTQLKKRYKIK